MSVISRSGLTLGYLTLPFLSAAGWPGSYFNLNSELSVRVLPSFQTEVDRTLDVHLVELGKTRTDNSEFRLKYEPGHPAADKNGNVKYPNVNPLLEMTDMREAQRSYEANINVISATRRMLQRTIDILKT